MIAKNRARVFAWALVGCLGAWAGPAHAAFNETKADYSRQFAQHQMFWTALQGFFPGLLWLMYDSTREPVWRTPSPQGEQ